MVPHHIYAVRGVAGVSMLVAVMLMIVSSVVFISRLEDLEAMKFRSSNVPLNISSTKATTKEKLEYTELKHNLNTLWVKNRTVLVSSSMLAILAGLLQLIFSTLVVLSDSKVITLYIRKWVTVHFILIFILLIILVNTFFLSEKNMEDQTWSAMILKFKNLLEKYRPHMDYSSVYRFLRIGKSFLYISVSTDIGMTVILMGGMLYLMRSQSGDYEQYE